MQATQSIRTMKKKTLQVEKKFMKVQVSTAVQKDWLGGLEQNLGQ